MATREAVAVDFMGVGTAKRSPDARSESQRGGRLVKPIPNGGHARRSPCVSEAGESSATHPFSSPSNNLHAGLRNKQPWNRRFTRSEEEHAGGTMAVVSPKRERASPDAPLQHAPHHHQSDNSAPASPSHTPAGEFWRMQQPQARMVQTMYAGHQQAASRTQQQQRTSPFRDEASQRGAQPSPEQRILATQPQPPSSQGAFGSPSPFHFQANGAAAAMAAKRSPFQNHPFQAGNLPGGHAVARPASGGGNKQPITAQLTIFYAGVVNVYDDVPFDKAQAIMLLAGSGNTWSGSNYMKSPAAGRNPFLKTPIAVPQSTPSTPGSPQQAPTTSGQPPRPGVVFSNNRQPPITNIELPQARKASLARFLEKRKDRVRKAPVNEEGDAPASASRDKSPERSAPSVHTTRSPSPAAAVQDQCHRSSPPSGNPRQYQQRDSPPSCSEASSPPSRPPGTPPRQNMLESEKRSPAPKRRDNAMDQTTLQQNSNKRARSGRSPHRLPHDPDDSSSLQTVQ